MLVTPKNSLIFNVLEKKYKEKIVLQLEDIRRQEKIDVKNNKITNISILSSTKKNRIGKKREMPVDVVDEIKIMGLQSFNQCNKLNHVEVSIQNSEVNVYLNRFSRHK